VTRLAREGGGGGLASGLQVTRVLGEVGGPGVGLLAPTLVVVAGLHGNEPAGVVAARRVLEALAGRETRIRGRVVFLSGNRKALAERVRFLDRDLNRAWTPTQVAELRILPGSATPDADPPARPPSAEDEEQRELLEALDSVLDTSPGPVYVLDLHTTSGPGGIFTTVGDTLENRAMALALPVPLVLGLEEMVDGTLQDYLGSRGVSAITFESGQHLEPEAVDRAEAGIWLLLAAAGLFPEGALPELAPARKLLVQAGRQLPRSLEIRYRHPVRSEDAFRMNPGWANFHRVRRGQVIAEDRSGPIRAPVTGRVLMPLYQPQGEDGFFMVREFHPFWLNLSRILRRARVDRAIHWFPGIRKDPERPGVLLVNRRIARWYALQLLHLLGFRRHRAEGEQLVVLRRPRAVRSMER
jgi:predicted deacylase